MVFVSMSLESLLVIPFTIDLCELRDVSRDTEPKTYNKNMFSST